jgi:hypothetical protein
MNSEYPSISRQLFNANKTPYGKEFTVAETLGYNAFTLNKTFQWAYRFTYTDNQKSCLSNFTTLFIANKVINPDGVIVTQVNYYTLTLFIPNSLLYTVT